MYKPQLFVQISSLMRFCLMILTIGLVSVTLAIAGPGEKAPKRTDLQGSGPHPELILRGVNLINGEGAPMRGPVDIVVKKNRITNIVSVGYPQVPIIGKRPVAGPNTVELDLTGHYVLPGFIDMHGHIGGSADNIPAEYVFKLWLAHGITTVREPGSFNGLDWVLDHVERSQKNTIVAPRIIPYLGFGMGSEQSISTPKQAIAWVKKAAKDGAKGIKFFGAPPAIIKNKT
jgi:hypothetical protein